MDPEMLKLANLAIQSFDKPKEPANVINMSFSVTPTEAKEISALLEKLRHG